MNLVLVLSPQDVFSLGLCMTEFSTDQAQEVTESILLKAGPALPQTYLSDLLHPAMLSASASCTNMQLPLPFTCFLICLIYISSTSV